MAMTMTRNMGQMDRIARGALGTLMLAHGLGNLGSGFRRFEGIVGAAFLFYGITGFDPLLKVFGVNTIPGDTDNLVNRIVKKNMPGQGFEPQQLQQPSPTDRTVLPAPGTVADEMAIG